MLFLVIQKDTLEYKINMKQKRQAPRSIRIDPEVEAWVKIQAKEGDRSLSAEINRVLRKAKEAAEQKQAA